MIGVEDVTPLNVPGILSFSYCANWFLWISLQIDVPKLFPEIGGFKELLSTMAECEITYREIINISYPNSSGYARLGVTQ